MTERLYVAGAMSGIADFNFPLFFATAGALRGLGYEVENPADNDGWDLETAVRNSRERSKGDWATYLKIDLPRLCRCDAVVALPGWRDSRGATLEVETARKLGMPIYRLDAGVLKPLVEVIGLSGYARSGKDSVAKVLVEEYGYTRLAFADTLREALYALNPNIASDFGVGPLREVVDRVGWDKAKVVFPEVRELLQRLGTEAGRDLIHPNVWVDATFTKMQDGGKYVISDVRFPNEADAVKQWGGKVWRIMRPDTGPANDHPSETALDDYLPDVRLHNDGTLDDLTVAVLELRLRDHVAA